ncbi:MAG: TlpA family protein disulfide reductase [Gemmatimonadaceae bacterium]
MRELDALGSRALAERIEAHSLLARAASAVGSADSILAEAAQVLTVAAAPAVRDSLVAQRTEAVNEAALLIADVYVSRRESVHARALLDSMEARFPDLPGLPVMLRAANRLYSMIGYSAPSLRADAWIGGESDVRRSWQGKVHVLEFTAHWCGPCRLSYPVLADIQRRFGPRDLGLVLETQTYGYFGSDTALTVADELERDRALFSRELPAAAAIAVALPPAGQHVEWLDPNKIAFGVKSLPVFAVVDRTGTIRDIWFGWMASSAARLNDDVRVALSATADHTR